ncbi:MAG: MmcQ/YjbR family DNA-binding protein [Clostridiaceae bacterium]|jgi:predicted DNA-binding protein (MmcQ/YjbR family)|nr:MmcQ/YjbR family DNA-binding protein [Clostridiaceae bacterium]
MDIKKIHQYCLSKNKAYFDFPFEPEPTVVKVGCKRFALIGDNSISPKREPFTAEHLRQLYPAVKPRYHLNKQHWNTVSIYGTVPDEELKWMVDHSYELVFKSLTQAEREKISEE